MHPFTFISYHNQQHLVCKQCTTSILITTPKTTIIKIPDLKQLSDKAVLWRAVSIGYELQFHRTDSEQLAQKRQEPQKTSKLSARRHTFLRVTLVWLGISRIRPTELLFGYLSTASYFWWRSTTAGKTLAGFAVLNLPTQVSQLRREVKLRNGQCRGRGYVPPPNFRHSSAGQLARASWSISGNLRHLMIFMVYVVRRAPTVFVPGLNCTE